jgi:hypothetical protein
METFTNLLHEFTSATGVYIGELLYPKKEIDDEDDDKAHINDEE